MIQSILHGFLLAFGLILPLGAQNVFVFNQGANHKSFKKNHTSHCYSGAL